MACKCLLCQFTNQIYARYRLDFSATSILAQFSLLKTRPNAQWFNTYYFQYRIQTLSNLFFPFGKICQQTELNFKLQRPKLIAGMLQTFCLEKRRENSKIQLKWRHSYYCLLIVNSMLSALIYILYLCALDRILLYIQHAQCTKVEFLDVIGTKVLRIFLLAIHNHLYYESYSSSPPPLEQGVWI
jgi:hypothetical protein